jgi:hypothetical protein
MSKSLSFTNAAVLLAVPALAYAHGQEVLLFPLGTLFSVAFSQLVVRYFSIKAGPRFLGIALAVGSVLPLWFLPGSSFPEFLRYSDWGNFLMGAAPPLVVAGLFYWAVGRRRNAL